MRKILLLAVGALLALAACKDKKNVQSDIITTDYEAPKPTAPKASSVTSSSCDVEWMDGRRYIISIEGHTVDSMMVENENGQKFIDNAITLEVMRADSTVFFKKTFSKASFANWLNRDYLEKGILEGMRFVEASSSNLVFVAWVNYPDAGDDEAVEMRLNIDGQGNTDIQRFTYDDREDLLTDNE